jgi:hypothetical protein
MSSAVNQPDTDSLSTLVRTKLVLVELLACLAQKQLAVAEHGETTEILRLLSAKQTVLARFGEIQRQLEPFRAQDPESRAWRSAADRLRCRQEAKRCDELLAEAMCVEKQGEAALLRRRDQAASRLAGASAASEAHAAYSRQPQSPAPAVQLHGEG